MGMDVADTKAPGTAGPEEDLDALPNAEEAAEEEAKYQELEKKVTPYSLGACLPTSHVPLFARSLPPSLPLSLTLVSVCRCSLLKIWVWKLTSFRSCGGRHMQMSLLRRRKRSSSQSEDSTTQPISSPLHELKPFQWNGSCSTSAIDDGDGTARRGSVSPTKVHMHGPNKRRGMGVLQLPRLLGCHFASSVPSSAALPVRTSWIL